jgi:hypothetical protein
MQEIERIQRMEQALDELSASQKDVSVALEAFSKHLVQWRELSEYYGSEAFHHDLAMDESGKLPAELKRGVLSEDAVYDLITELCTLADEMQSTADSIKTYMVK